MQACVEFRQSDENLVVASDAQELCGIALIMTLEEKIKMLNMYAKAWYSSSQADYIHEAVFRAQGFGRFADRCKEEGDEVILVDTGLPAGTPEEVPDENSILYTGKDICSYMEAFAALGYKPEQVTKILKQSV